MTRHANRAYTDPDGQTHITDRSARQGRGPRSMVAVLVISLALAILVGVGLGMIY